LITEAALAFLAGLAAAAFLPGRRRGFLGFLADHFIEAHAVFGGELLHALQQIFLAVSERRRISVSTFVWRRRNSATESEDRSMVCFLDLLFWWQEPTDQ
jgi:hypothetical protein